MKDKDEYPSDFVLNIAKSLGSSYNTEIKTSDLMELIREIHMYGEKLAMLLRLTMPIEWVKDDDYTFSKELDDGRKVQVIISNIAAHIIVRDCEENWVEEVTIRGWESCNSLLGRINSAIEFLTEENEDEE